MEYAYARESSISPSSGELHRSFVDRGFPDASVFVDRRTKNAGAAPRLDELQAIVREGDTILVWNVESLGRTSRQILDNIEPFARARAHLVFLAEGIDTEEPMGLYRLAEVLDSIQRHPRKNPETFDKAVRLYVAGEMTGEEICERTGISRWTLYRELKRRECDLRRPRTNPKALDEAVKLYVASKMTGEEICERTGISRGILYRELKRRGCEFRTRRGAAKTPRPHSDDGSPSPGERI